MVVVHVDADVAPRPVLVRLRAPIRLSGRNATADRNRLLQLAREEPSARVLPMGRTSCPRTWRGATRARPPLSERTVDAQALNDSVFPQALNNLGNGAIDHYMGFRLLGHNRARKARLVWQATGRPAEKTHLVETVVSVDLPEPYDSAATSPVASITIDIIARVRQHAEGRGKAGRRTGTRCRTWPSCSTDY